MILKTKLNLWIAVRNSNKCVMCACMLLTEQVVKNQNKKLKVKELRGLIILLSSRVYACAILMIKWPSALGLFSRICFGQMKRISM